MLLLSEKYINYQTHTKYCPGYRVLLSQENGGENLFLIEIPNLYLGLISQWILGSILKIKKSYFFAYLAFKLFFISLFSSFQGNYVNSPSFSSINLLNYALNCELTTMAR
jgi:hypothetical protein